MSDPTNWGASVRVSMPAPLSPDNPGLVDMDGFCFTANGIAHNLSLVDWEKLAVPTFSPENPAQSAVRYDAALDRFGEKSG
jgi:hypothetical protein